MDPWMELLPLVARLGARDPAAAPALERWLEGKPVSVVLGIDRALRDRGRHARLRLSFADPPVEHVQLWADSSVALGILSCVRSGWVRERAVSALDALRDRWATAFLLARLGDPVVSVSRAAEIALLHRRSAPALLVACLPLLDLARRRARWQAQTLDGLDEAVASRPDLLRQAAAGGDSALVWAASARLVLQARGTDAIGEALQGALSDPHPRVRRWAAGLAVDEGWTPGPVRQALLDGLVRDRSPAVKLLAVRALAREGREDLLFVAALDRNAEVRYQARRWLKGRGDEIVARARGVLQHGASTRDALVGALGALSDLGLPADIPLLQRFAEDERLAVAREARRALPRLGG
jgi:HEAT repeat protein